MKKLLLLVTLLWISVSGFGQDIGGLYVAPPDHPDTPGSDVTGNGSYLRPWGTWQKAFNVAQAGDIVYFRGGVYYPEDHGYEIYPKEPGDRGNSGTAENPIRYYAYPGEKPILDCRNVYPEFGSINYAIDAIEAEYIHFKGLTIRNLYGRTNPVLAVGLNFSECANITFENMTVHDVSGRGCYFTSGVWPAWRYGSEGFLTGPDTTRFINCDFYNLCDSVSDVPGNAADGIFAQNFEGGIFIIDSCRFWDYTDDGCDLSGDGYRIIRNSWFMSGGKYGGYFNEANAMKLTAPHFEGDVQNYSRNITQVHNCVIVFCIGHGIYLDIFKDYEDNWNSNALIYNNTVYKCGRGIEEIGLSGHPRSSTYRNNYSAHCLDNFDAPFNTVPINVAIYNPSAYIESHNTWDATMKDLDYPGYVMTDSVDASESNFINTDSLYIIAQFTALRSFEGKLPNTRPLELDSTSNLRDAGKDVGLPYVGTNPDIGAWEWTNQPGNKCPSVAILSPEDRSSYSANDQIDIEVSAHDDDMLISMDIYIGDTLAFTKTEEPWSFEWAGAPVGVHKIKAVGTDSGGCRVSSVVEINVGMSQSCMIYPNPSYGKFTVSLSEALGIDSYICVNNLSGKLVDQLPIYHNERQKEFDFSGIDPGYYIISIPGSTACKDMEFIKL